MVSDMSTTRSGPKRRNTARTTLGWMCTPSQMELDHDAGRIEGRADDAGGAVGEGRHGVEEVRGLPRAAPVGLHGGVVVRRGVRERDRDLAGDVLDELHRPRAPRGATLDELDEPAARLREAAEHGGVGLMEPFAVLRALLGHGEEGPLEVYAHELRAGLISVPRERRRLRQTARELLLGKRHARGANLRDAAAELVERHRLEPRGVGVGEVPRPCSRGSAGR